MSGYATTAKPSTFGRLKTSAHTCARNALNPTVTLKNSSINPEKATAQCISTAASQMNNTWADEVTQSRATMTQARTTLNAMNAITTQFLWTDNMMDALTKCVPLTRILPTQVKDPSIQNRERIIWVKADMDKSLTVFDATQSCSMKIDMRLTKGNAQGASDPPHNLKRIIILKWEWGKLYAQDATDLSRLAQMCAPTATQATSTAGQGFCELYNNSNFMTTFYNIIFPLLLVS